MVFKILTWEAPTPEALVTEPLLLDGTKFVLVSGRRVEASVTGLVWGHATWDGAPGKRPMVVSLGAGTLVVTLTPKVVEGVSRVARGAGAVPREVKGAIMAAWVVRVLVGTVRVMRVVGWVVKDAARVVKIGAEVVIVAGRVKVGDEVVMAARVVKTGAEELRVVKTGEEELRVVKTGVEEVSVVERVVKRGAEVVRVVEARVVKSGTEAVRVLATVNVVAEVVRVVRGDT